MTTDSSPTRSSTGMAARPMPEQTAGDPRRFRVKGWLLWVAGFVSFPIAGIAATAAAMGIGLLAGAWVVGYSTSIGELAVMGAITGIPLGAVQAFLLRGRVARSWMWAAAMPLLWALGWTVTAAAGVGVDSQYAVFGAFGAITFMALSGVLLDRLLATTPSARHVPPTATA